MKKIVVILLFNFILSAVFFIGALAALYSVRNAITWYSLSKMNKNTYPTGQEVLAQLNVYRKESGLPAFILSEPLCNNIGARWKSYKDNNSHKGLAEFAAKYNPGVQVAEILVSGLTAQEMVEKWSQSPSHDISIKNHSKICVYSADGLSVALLSN